MAQYIDKDALVAEIIRRRKAIPKEEDDKRLKAVYGNEAFVLTGLLEYIDTLEVKGVQEEPVSEFLNTESMIESYYQRLISQANSMKNSPLIDMCLVSYKHGINETLDTLNLSNVQRNVKNWKEPVSVDLEKYYHDFLQKEWFGNSHVRTVSEMMAFTAKHFFELGLNASNPLTWEDIKEICVQSVLVEIDLGRKVSDERHYTEVLKRFKDYKEREINPKKGL